MGCATRRSLTTTSTSASSRRPASGTLRSTRCPGGTSHRAPDTRSGRGDLKQKYALSSNQRGRERMVLGPPASVLTQHPLSDPPPKRAVGVDECVVWAI